jgi:hypothetical protein
MVLVEARTTGGAPIMQETQADIKCRHHKIQKAYKNSDGVRTTSDSYALSNEESGFEIGDVLSVGGYDYAVDGLDYHEVEPGDGRNHYELFLKGRTAAPATREEAVDLTGGDMTKAVYDIDEDGIVDYTEGVREVSEFPSAPKKGDLVLKDGELYVCTGT